MTCSVPVSIVLLAPTVKRETRVTSVGVIGVYVTYRWFEVAKSGASWMPISPFSCTLETGIVAAVVTPPVAGL